MSKVTRKQVENKWLKKSKEQSERGLNSGVSLCMFLRNLDSNALSYRWEAVWCTPRRLRVYIASYFEDESDQGDLSYLCRALSLHMLLDDNQDIY